MRMNDSVSVLTLRQSAKKRSENTLRWLRSENSVSYHKEKERVQKKQKRECTGSWRWITAFESLSLVYAVQR